MLSVACNGAHRLEERLARWLLMMRDRSDDDALPITQHLLAEMLGVQRPTITNATEKLERAGLNAADGRSRSSIGRASRKRRVNATNWSGRASLFTFL